MKYDKLTQEEKVELMEKYSIPDRDGEYFTGDINFVLHFKSKLAGLFAKICSGLESTNRMKSKEEATEDFEQIVKDVYNFVRNVDYGNFSRRLVFINNIGQEIKDLCSSLAVDPNIGLSYLLAEENVDNIEDFLTYVACDALAGDINKLSNEQASHMANKFTNLVNDNFLVFVDENNLTNEDIYFIIGEVARRTKDSEKELNEFLDKTCNRCEKDDCMYPPCEFNGQKNFHWNTFDSLSSCLNALVSKVEGRYYNVGKWINMLQDEELKGLVIKVLNAKDLPKGKKINLTLSMGQWANINEELVKEFLKDKTQNGAPNFKDPKQVAAFIVLYMMDFSKASGKMELEVFKKKWKKLQKQFENADERKSQFFISEAEMKEIFEKEIKHAKEKGEE